VSLVDIKHQHRRQNSGNSHINVAGKEWN